MRQKQLAPPNAGLSTQAGQDLWILEARSLVSSGFAESGRQRKQANERHSPHSHGNSDQAHANAGVIDEFIPFCAHVRSPSSLVLFT
jgi:hypothetical protein